MPTSDLIHLVLTALVAMTLLFRFVAMRRNPGDRAVSVIFWAVLCLLVVLLLGYPAWYWAVYRLLGEVPSLPQLLQYLAAMAMFYWAAVFTLCLVTSDPEELRRGLVRRRRVLLVAVALLTICFAVGPFRLGMPMLGWKGQHEWGPIACVLTMQLYGGYVLLGTIRLWWGNRLIERRFLRIGLRLMGIGSVFGCLQVVHKIAYLMATGMDVTLPWDESGPNGIQAMLLLPAVLSLMVGILLPSWGAKIARSWTRERCYRQLEPLVTALGEVLADNAPVQLKSLRGRRSRLRNRVIDIRDALIGPLRVHLSAEVYEDARSRSTRTGVGDEEAKAVAEAVCIAAALTAFRMNVRYPKQPALTFANDLEAEAAWLARVGKAFKAIQSGSSRTASTFLSEVDAGEPVNDAGEPLGSTVCLSGRSLRENNHEPPQPR